MLTSAKARVNGPLFVLGWLVGLGIVGAIVLAVADPTGASKSGSPATWVSWVKIVLGVLLLLVAARQFRSRPRGDEEPDMPKWMATIDKTTPLAAFGLAAALSGANPKNLLLAVAGAAAIAQTGIPGVQQALAYLVFAMIATLGVGIPVGIYFALGERSARLLAGAQGLDERAQRRHHDRPVPHHRGQAHRRRDQRAYQLKLLLIKESSLAGRRVI
jgi:threonine/homoserine/homoserine lactone efflux protein